MKNQIQKYLPDSDILITGLFIVLLPFIFSKELLDPALYSRYMGLSIWLLVVSLLFFRKALRNELCIRVTRSVGVFFVSGGVFVLINILSSFGAINSYEAVFKVFKEFTLMLSLFYLYIILKEAGWARDFLIRAVLIMGMMFFLIALKQLSNANFDVFFSAKSDYAYYLRQAIVNVKSTLTNWNLFAYYNLLTLPFALYGVLYYKSVWRVLSGSVLLLAIFFTIILASKGGWASMLLFFVIVSMFTYWYIFFRYTKETGRRLSVLVKLGLLLLPVAFVVAGINVINRSDIKVFAVIGDKTEQILHPEKAFAGRYNKDNPTSAETRMLVWANTVKMIEDYPVLGAGPGQWRVLYAKYGVDGFEDAIRNGTKHFQRPHNDFLWIAGETGVLGLIFYLIIYVGVLLIALKGAITSKDNKKRVLNILFFAVLISFMLPMSVSFVRERIVHNVLYLFIIAIVFSLNEGEIKEYGRDVGKSFVFLLFGVVIGANLFNMKLATDMFRGDKVAYKMSVAYKMKRYNLLYREAKLLEKTFYTLDPFATPVLYYKGVALAHMDKMPQARLEFHKAYELHPYHLQTLNNLATSINLTGNKDTALVYYQKALQISPRFREALLNVTIVYYNKKMFGEALTYLLKIPYSKYKPNKKYNKAILAVCRRYAKVNMNKYDMDKFVKWYKNENKIKDTFVKTQRTNITFNKILYQELGK